MSKLEIFVVSKMWREVGMYVMVGGDYQQSGNNDSNCSILWRSKKTVQELQTAAHVEMSANPLLPIFFPLPKLGCPLEPKLIIEGVNI